MALPIPNSWEERKDAVVEHQPTDMKTNDTHVITHKIEQEAGHPKKIYKITREILEGTIITEEDIDTWYYHSFSVAAILRWHKAGFKPDKAKIWEKEGFSSSAAIYCKEATILLEWATPMRKLNVRNKEALTWMSLSKHQDEITQAVKAKPPLTTAKEWWEHRFNLYEATEYFLAF
ncbi:hypothetical protein DSO57_1005432 [Entomophthora muscae]|uniref:Uncharacterized protein n=1 Tax=Entomophthora muscae TaxID=34485 RepID=A0ACC2SL04_9FUNG|nr:hypothetical protein DSO57_1005432 [Entomophthora muscae]